MTQLRNLIRDFMFGDEDDFGIPVTEKTEEDILNFVFGLIPVALGMMILGLLYHMIFNF